MRHIVYHYIPIFLSSPILGTRLSFFCPVFVRNVHRVKEILLYLRTKWTVSYVCKLFVCFWPVGRHKDKPERSAKKEFLYRAVPSSCKEVWPEHRASPWVPWWRPGSCTRQPGTECTPWRPPARPPQPDRLSKCWFNARSLCQVCIFCKKLYRSTNEGEKILSALLLRLIWD